MSTVTELLDPVAEASRVKVEALNVLRKENDSLHEALNKEQSDADRSFCERRDAIYASFDIACGKVHETYRDTIKALSA